MHRVIFHEITKNAVREAIANPREISGDLVGAQQARRALDYLVGFNLSPLAVEKSTARPVRRPRAKSPALRMIVERELEIEAFKAREYWTIEADVSKDEQPFLYRGWSAYKGDKVEQFSFRERRPAARDVEKTLRRSSQWLPRCHKRYQAPAPPQPCRTVHDVDAATGSFAQAGFQYATHDAGRAKTLRRHRIAR